MGYFSDRAFTDNVHRVALGKIYAPLGWEECDVDPDYLENIDLNKGVDYIFENAEGKK